MKKKSDVQILIDKRVAEIESWGILTLMSRMKEAFLHDLERDRKTVVNYCIGKYEDSNLQCVDRITDAFERVYNKEFAKIYNQIKKEYDQLLTIKTEIQ